MEINTAETSTEARSDTETLQEMFTRFDAIPTLSGINKQTITHKVPVKGQLSATKEISRTMCKGNLIGPNDETVNVVFYPRDPEQNLARVINLTVTNQDHTARIEVATSMLDPNQIIINSYSRDPDSNQWMRTYGEMFPPPDAKEFGPTMAATIAENRPKSIRAITDSLAILEQSEPAQPSIDTPTENRPLTVIKSEPEDEQPTVTEPDQHSEKPTNILQFRRRLRFK